MTDDQTNGLEVRGSVARPSTFDRFTLSTLDHQVPDIGALVAGREGSGVRLRAILDAAGPAPEASFVTLESADGTFAASVPIADVEDAVVLHSLGDQALPAELGGPFRFLIPDADRCNTGGADRCATVKFLGRLTVTESAGRDTRKVP